MKKPKIFIACDTTNITKVKKIINQSQSNKIKIGYKFGLEFINSKNGRKFVSSLKNKIIFIDLKLNDTVNTMLSAVKALKDLKLIGYNKSVKSLVNHQARLAKKAALDAIVCSPYEVRAVRKIFKKEIITPGVQIGKKNYDQKRSMEAKKVKSDWLVIGRAITQGNIKKNIQNLTKELR